MELTDAQTTQLCLSPFLIYALVTGRGPAGAPREELRFLRAIEYGLEGHDPLGEALVEGLKNNLHRYHALYRASFAEADPVALFEGLDTARQFLEDLAARGADTLGYRKTLISFASHLVEACDFSERERRAATVAVLFA